MGTWIQDYIKTYDDSAFKNYIRSFIPQGKKGDPGIPGTGAVVSYSAVNKDSITLIAGTPITEDVSGSGFVRANANITSKFCVGFLLEDIAPTFSGNISLIGSLILTDWTLIVGTATLSAKTKYFLDTTAGKITSTPPVITGQSLQIIGTSLDSLTLSINIGNSILL